MLDLGVRLLDLARYFLGEFDRVGAVTQRVNPAISGEDSATILLRGVGGAACVVEMSYASTPAKELFPEVRIEIEGPEGSLEVIPGEGVFRKLGTGKIERCSVPDPVWALPEAKVASAAVHAFQRNWIDCVRNGSEPETSARQNLRTLELVDAAYAAARDGCVVQTGDGG